MPAEQGEPARYDSFGDSDWNPEPPSGIGGDCAWWFDSLWPLLAPFRARLPAPEHLAAGDPVFLTEHLCAGTGADVVFFELLDVRHRCLAMADKKRASQDAIHIH